MTSRTAASFSPVPLFNSLLSRPEAASLYHTARRRFVKLCSQHRRAVPSNCGPIHACRNNPAVTSQSIFSGMAHSLRYLYPSGQRDGRMRTAGSRADWTETYGWYLTWRCCASESCQRGGVANTKAGQTQKWNRYNYEISNCTHRQICYDDPRLAPGAEIGSAEA